MAYALPTNPRVSGSRGGSFIVSSDMRCMIEDNEVSDLTVRGVLGGTTPIFPETVVANNKTTGATTGITAYIFSARFDNNIFAGDSLISQRFFDGSFGITNLFCNSEIRNNKLGSLVAEAVQALIQNNEFLAAGVATGRCLVDCTPYILGLPLRIQTQGNQVVGPAGPGDQSSMAIKVDLVTEAPVLYGKSGQNVLGALGAAATRPVSIVDAADADIPAAGTPNFFSDATDVVVAGISTTG